MAGGLARETEPHGTPIGHAEMASEKIVTASDKFGPSGHTGQPVGVKEGRAGAREVRNAKSATA